jgi:hypothetical protein
MVKAIDSPGRIPVFEVSQTDQPFGSEKGRKDFAGISSRLAGGGKIVALDMSRLRIVDSSWAREVIGNLIERHRGRHAFYLDRVTHAVVNENVDAALFRRGVCVLSRDPDGSYQVLGRRPTEEALAVLRVVEKKGETTARAICSALDGLSIQACNNRLKDLLEAGLIVREEGQPAGGGREFVYRALGK